MARLVVVPLLLATLLASGGAPRPILSSPMDETEPFASPGALVWTEARQEFRLIHLGLGDIVLRRDGRPARRINPPGTLAASGGVDATRLVLQVVDRGGSDLRIVDLATGTARTPSGLDTPLYEWRGSLAGPLLLLGRNDFGAHRFQVVLHDLETGRERVLGAAAGHGAYAEPGQVAGRFASYAVCPDNLCSLFRYDARTHRTVGVPNPEPYSHTLYAPAVAADGTVYYARGNLACGSGVTLLRWRPGTVPTLLARLPDGFDLRFASTVPQSRGSRILFDRYDCRRKSWDVYGIDDRR